MLTHNINTTPSASKIRTNPDVDHYIRLDAKCTYKKRRYYCNKNTTFGSLHHIIAIYFSIVSDTCPGDGFPHPYKARCYEVVNTPKTYLDAVRHCNKADGKLALIPNRLTLKAIWDDIVDK